MFALICVSINGWVNNREAGDLRRYRAHSDVTVMLNKWDMFYAHIPSLAMIWYYLFFSTEGISQNKQAVSSDLTAQKE